MEAADVLPVRSSTMAALSMGMPSRLRAASMIRMLAWWGTTRPMSSMVTPARSMALVAAASRASTARRKTSLPFMKIFPPCSQVRMLAAEPSDMRSQPKRVGLLADRSMTTAPAPSPNRTQVPRSVQSMMPQRPTLPITKMVSTPPSANCMAVTRP